MGLDAQTLEKSAEGRITGGTVKVDFMTQDIEKNNLKKILLFIVGCAMLVLGVALILHHWEYTVVIFKGVVGIFLALFGLFLMLIAK